MCVKLNQDVVVSDVMVFFYFLDEQFNVDLMKQGVVMGYCMSGVFIMYVVVVLFDCIGVIVSFYGGGLVIDKENSFYLIVVDLDVLVLYVIVENDNECVLNMKLWFIEVYKQVGIVVDVEVYYGILYGWILLDLKVYNEE